MMNEQDVEMNEVLRQQISATKEGQPLHLVSIGYADRIKQHFGVEE